MNSPTPRWLALAWTVVVAALTACDPPVDGIVDDDNEPPVARLVGPQIARVSEPARFDASSSDDVDGQVTGLSLVFSDGTPTAEDIAGGVFDHIFEAPGRVVVRVEAEDDDFAVTIAEVEVVVIDGAIEACSCDAPCLDAGVCAETTCHVRTTSADEEPPAINGELLCE
jgi:hypothetical protein